MVGGQLLLPVIRTPPRTCGAGFSEVAPLLVSLGFTEIHLPWDKENPVPLTDYL